MDQVQGPDSMPDIGTLSFEEAFQRLSETVKSMETGGLTIGKATAYYENGMSLVRRCSELLNEAELKVSQLRDGYSGARRVSDRNEEEYLENA